MKQATRRITQQGGRQIQQQLIHQTGLQQPVPRCSHRHGKPRAAQYFRAAAVPIFVPVADADIESQLLASS